MELFEASKANNIEKIKLLIDEGKDVNAKIFRMFFFTIRCFFICFETALHWAAINGSLEATKILIEKGADPNAQTSYFKETPLHLAIQENQKSIIRFLIDNGSNPNIKNYEGENSIFLAIRWSDAEILELLLDKNGDPNTYNKLAASPLHLCVDFRDYDCARTLLKHNANPNYQNNDGKTPFHNAVEQREYKLSSIFAENGANSEIRDAQLRTVWMLADDSFKRKVLHDEKGKMNEEIRKEINENENGSEGMKDICFLCKTRKANRVLLPCGHRVLCSYCSRKFLEQYNICPKCHMAVFGSSLR